MTVSRWHFRAWDKTLKRMLDELIEEGDINILDMTCHPESSYILMQSTGLEDKNGKEIFEGDIVTVPFGNKKPLKMEVKWYYGHFYFADNTYAFDFFKKNPARSKIIGNVYENSDLAKSFIRVDLSNLY